MYFLKILLSRIPLKENDSISVFSIFQSKEAQSLGLCSMDVTSVSRNSIHELLSLARVRFELGDPDEVLLERAGWDFVAPQIAATWFELAQRAWFESSVRLDGSSGLLSMSTAVREDGKLTRPS